MRLITKVLIKWKFRPIIGGVCPPYFQAHRNRCLRVHIILFFSIKLHTVPILFEMPRPILLVLFLVSCIMAMHKSSDIAARLNNEATELYNTGQLPQLAQNVVWNLN